MRITHILGGRLFTGAGRGLLWLHEALLDLGVDSHILVQYAPESAGPAVTALAHDRRDLSTLRQRLLSRYDKWPVRKYAGAHTWLFSPGQRGNRLSDHPLVRSADVVNLHWVNNGMVSSKEIARIEAKIVWTLRDMWALTGGCHISLQCEKYETGCGACPVLGSNSEEDLSARRSADKRSDWQHKQITWVPISHWLGDCMRNSHVFNAENHCIHQIYNGVDMGRFFPVDRNKSRAELDIPSGRGPVVLSGALNNNVPYKGFGKYKQAILHLIERKQDFHLAFFGSLDESEFDGLPVSFTNLGMIHDDAHMRMAYAAADIFVAPSIQESFGKTIVESMACGTPVVCFAATGPGELVHHRQTGYTARPYDPEDLADGIQWLAERTDEEKLTMRQNASEDAVARFSTKVIAQEYVALYQQLMSN